VASQVEHIQRIESRFRVGGWLVEPSLNRLSRDGTSVQLALKVMDVLLCLAARPGELVAKHELTDVVWQTEYVSDNTLTKRIAELRDALGDDAKHPRYVETIPKRGYRLIAEVSADGETAVTAELASEAPASADVTPYPGLAPFTEADADHFFGREREIAQLWRKITNRRLLAVVGPSGAGKSSLLRAGVVAGAPKGWRAVVCHPGDEPFLALARALAPDLSGDTEEMRQLLAIHDPDVALAVTARWRGRWDEALVVVDQFEELFTVTPGPLRERFVELLRRLVDAAGIHLVLVLRDDFLLECHAYAELAPIFADLTPVGPPAGPELRRAITEPAAGRLYGFESETLVDEMVAEVETERGALPLVAFAVSRLWQLRDRERRMLTREAYDEIGGVGGALARHAEATLEAIGPERLPIVRELFRNLVTAQGTRAVREVDDLLSVFERSALPSVASQTLDVRRLTSHSERSERSRLTSRSEQSERSPSHSSPACDAAAEVLADLIDARLLTSFEEDAGDRRHRRVEIVHESLLRAWPRLVRWQTQDADAAQLRDQLRQAAELWRARGEPDDLLWSGSSFREFQLWRERYAGGLSSTEESFARAMTRHAARRRKRRRIVAVGVLLVTAAVAVVMTILWHRSELRTRQLEVRRLCEVADQEMARCPPRALAAAQAGLELLDTPDGRRLALEALWRSPMPVYLTPENHPGPDEMATITVDFSPDGRWLVADDGEDGLALWSCSGGPPTLLHTGYGYGGLFLPDSKSVWTDGFDGSPLIVWSVPDGARLGTIAPLPVRQDGTRDTFPDSREAWNMARLERPVRDPATDVGWRFDDRVVELLRRLPGERYPPAAIGPRGSRLLAAVDDALELYSIDDPEAPPLLLERVPTPVEHVAWQPGGEHAATIDIEGTMHLWSLAGDAPERLRTWPGDGERVVCSTLVVDATGSSVAAIRDDGTVILRTVHDPPGSDPLRLIAGGWRGVGVDFSPDGRWLALSDFGGGSVWPVARERYPYVLRGHTGAVGVAFTPDSRRLVSNSLDGTVREWPLDHADGARPRVLYDWGHPIQQALANMAISPDGRFLVAVGGERSVRLIPLDGGPSRQLGFFDQRPWVVAVGPDGRRVAACGLDGTRVWNLETGTSNGVDLICVARTFMFAPDGRLLVSDRNEVVAIDPETGERTAVLGGAGGGFRLARNGALILAQVDGGVAVYDRERGVATRLDSHGDRVEGMAINPDGTIVATSTGAVIRVGSVESGTTRWLIADSPVSYSLAISPDGRWIASGHDDGTIRLWPMPDSSRPVLHDLPRDELLALLRTRLDVVANDLEPVAGPSGAPFRVGPFPGWERFPKW
jgi:DNA-binding winged helix-turn-helix (wHTH) protein/WD40 repeat protein